MLTRNLIFVSILLLSCRVIAKPGPQYNKFRLPVIDSTWALEPQQYETFRNRVIRYNKTSPYEIVVVFIKYTHGKDTWELAKEMAISGRYSQKPVSKLLLILPVMKDRDIGFYRGRDVEKQLDYKVLDDIFRNTMLPLFAKQKPYEGIEAGTSAFINVLRGGEYPEEKSVPWGWAVVIAIAGLSGFGYLIYKKRAAV